MIPTVFISMRLGEYSKRYSLQNAKFCLRHLSAKIPVTIFLEADVSLIRMKLAVKDSLYLFSPMEVVAFR